MSAACRHRASSRETACFQVENLCSEEVKEAMQLKRLLYRGLEGRRTAANALNAQSASHFHLAFKSAEALDPISSSPSRRRKVEAMRLFR